MKTAKFRGVRINIDEVKLLKEFEDILKHKFKIVKKIIWEPFSINELLTKADNYYYNDQKDKVDFVWQLMVSNNSVSGIGLYYNSLQIIPDLVSKFKSLEYLVMHGGDLKYVPESIGKLRNLEVLNIASTLIEHLPESFGNLNSLTHLFLGGSHLKILPKSFGELKSLEHLRLDHNYLKILPDSMKNLNSLRILNLQDSGIQEVPEWIGDLNLLEDLYLGENNLPSIPKTLQKLNSLKMLDLKKNNLLELPNWIINIKSLKYIGIEKNEGMRVSKTILHRLKAHGVHVNIDGGNAIIEHDIDERMKINKIFEKGEKFINDEKYDKALDILDKSNEMIEGLTKEKDLWEFKSKLLHLQGRIYQLQGNYNEALMVGKEMLLFNEKLEDPCGRAIALNNMGNACNLNDNVAGAIRYYEKAIEIFKDLGLDDSKDALIINDSLENLKKKIQKMEEGENLLKVKDIESVSFEFNSDVDYIKELKQAFREKRTYGDKEDFEGIKIKLDEKGNNCKILKNEYYSYFGFGYQNNSEAENDSTNYIEMSVENMEELIKIFIERRSMIAGIMKQPMFRIDLKSPPLLANVIPMDLSSYYLSTYKLKDEIYRRNTYYGDAEELKELARIRNEIVIKMNETNKDLTNLYVKAYRKVLDKSNEIIKKHLEHNIGKVEHSSFIEDYRKYPFYIHQIPASEDRDFGVITTCGFSPLNMNTPKEFKHLFEHIELMYIIPQDFPFPLENSSSHKYDWVFKNYINFFNYIFESKRAIGHNHTFATDPSLLPFSEKTKFCGYLFRFAFDDFPPFFCELTLPYLRNIHFIKLIPLFENEVKYLIENREQDEFIKRYKDEGIPLNLDNNRKSLF